VPSQNSRNWDFSTAGFKVIDFLTGGQFPGGIIPQSRIDPAASSAIAGIPLPNASGGSPGNALFQASGNLPASGHISLTTLGLPTRFGGFVNVPFVQGTRDLAFSLVIDGVTIDTKTASFVIK
jgi:hypothetical protein